jgi:hypothetical protein
METNQKHNVEAPLWFVVPTLGCFQMETTTCISDSGYELCTSHLEYDVCCTSHLAPCTSRPRRTYYVVRRTLHLTSSYLLRSTSHLAPGWNRLPFAIAYTNCDRESRSTRTINCFWMETKDRNLRWQMATRVRCVLQLREKVSQNTPYEDSTCMCDLVVVMPAITVKYRQGNCTLLNKTAMWDFICLRTCLHTRAQYTSVERKWVRQIHRWVVYVREKAHDTNLNVLSGKTREKRCSKNETHTTIMWWDFDIKIRTLRCYVECVWH